MGGMTPAVDIGDNPAEVHSARDHDLFSFYGCFPAESAAGFAAKSRARVWLAYLNRVVFRGGFLGVTQ
jgi:hypothetical protein